MKDIEDWLGKGECRPFEDSLGNLCITVKSEYESFGGDQEARLNEAKEYGIDRLIRFYGKSYISEPLSTSLSPIAQSDNEIKLSQVSIAPTTPTKLYDAASTPEYFISPIPCARMKVLVKIPKDTFDDYTVNSAFCDIDKPSEGYLSAFISVENYERDIDYITTSMEDFLPKMAKADKYITNVSIVEEIKNLRGVKRVIRRYFNLNSVEATAIKEEECEPDVESLMEIGFSNDYKPVFALIDGNKHTIGYDCFLEASKINHSTTANYLIQLRNMSSDLRKQLSLDFDIFQFLTQYTYPTPVVETKNNTLDGLKKYDSNGNLFSFANLAKLITLDLDKKSCKTNEEVERENSIIHDGATKRNIVETARQSREFVGNNTFSESEGWKDLKKTGGSIRDATVRTAIDKVYDDVLNKIDFNCVLEESLKCSLEAAITRLGEAAFDDPDLSEFFNADGVIEVFGFGGCGPDDNCDNELQLKVGLPIFQGIKIPDDFPTVDYLAKTIDAALKKLYDVLIDAIVSFITGIFELMCKAVSATDFAAIGSMFGDGFTSWLSKTIGVDASMLADGEAWADAVLSTGGAGFMGVIGNFVSKTAGSTDSNGDWVWGGSVTAVYSGTGISLNLPNPSTGLIEQVFVSQEFIYQTLGEVKKATEDVEAITTPEEYNSICKGAAPEVVLDSVYDCLHGNNPEMFESPEDVSDLFIALGEIVNGNFLENPTTTSFSVPNACQLGDGTEQDQMARNYLTSKDPLLSDSEIEELLSQEKNRLIEKVKKIHKLHKSFQDGTLFPSFPSLFGSDDSLIPETPPVISAALATVSEGLYSSTINSFNVSMTQYVPLWTKKWELGLDIDGDPMALSFAEHSKNLMKDDTQQPIWLNLLVDNSLTTLGYKIATTAKDDIVAEVTEASSELSLGIYEWYKGNFDAGKWTTEKFNYQGDDDVQFEELLVNAGIRVVDLSTSVWEVLGKVLLVTILSSVLIVGTIGMGAIVVAGILGTGLAWGTLAGAVLGVTAILAGLMYLSAAVYGIWQLIQYFAAAEEEEITEEYVKCLHSSGKITVSEYDAIVPQIDELVEKTKTAQDMLQWGEIQAIANHLEDLDDENGSHEKIFDISAMLVEPKIGFKTELILKSEVSGQWNLLKEDVFYTKAIIREIPYTSEEVALERPDGFNEVITSFERRGVKIDASSAEEGSMTPLEFNDTGYLAVYGSGTSLAEYDRVENKISNYRIENEEPLLLGRKIPEPNFLETRYSSTIEAPDKTIMEFFESQVASDSKLQEYHLRLLEILEEIIPEGETSDTVQSILTTYKNDVVGLHEVIWKACIENMAERVSNNRLYRDEYLNGLELEYPKQDILGYKKVSEESVDLTNSIMKLESSNDDYCDALSPLRRSGSITGLRLIIRTFIVERVLNSLQVFDTFNKGFMTSDMFKKAVFDDIKVEMNKYYQSFASTLEDKIFSDMKEVASKYFEIQRLLGNEVPEINTGKEAILEIIKMEIDDIGTTIDSQLKLDEFYHSLSWDDFVFDILLTSGNYSSPGESDDASDYVDFNGIMAPSTLASFEANTRLVKIDEDTYTYVAEILFLGIDKVISAECDGPPPTATADDCTPIGDYSKAKALLFNNEIYQDLVSYVFPLKDAATLLSTYHLSAITDPAVFSATVDGKHVTDLFAETKLSTLQVFLASIHGAGEMTYIDPFLEKLKT